MEETVNMRMKALVMGLLLFGCGFIHAQEKAWTLQECVNYALENNITVRQTELDTQLAEEDLVSAKGNFLPNLSGAASHSYSFGSYIGQDGSRISRDSRGNSFSLNTGIVLFNGFQNTNIYKQAQLGIESSELQLAILKDNISLNVVNAYLNILLNRENLKIAEEQIGVSQQQVDQMQVLVDEGSKPRADLLDAKSQLASDQESLINTQNSVDLAILSLAQLLQLPPNGFNVITEDVDPSGIMMEYTDPSAIYDYAVENRPEIKNALMNIEYSDYNVKIAKGAYYPTLTLGANMNTSYQHLQGQEDLRAVLDLENNQITYVENGFGTQISDNLGYNVGFNLNVPIFNRFQTNVNVHKAQINKEKVELALEQEKQDLRSNIEQAYADARAAFKQFEASQVSLLAQEEAYKNAQESYNLGIMTSYDFEQVRNRYVNAQASIVNAKYNFIFKTKVLDFYLGKPIID